MVLLAFSSKLSEKEIQNDAKSVIRKVKKWFDKNPERKTCLVELWYGFQKRVNRTNFEKVINNVANKCIKVDKKEKK